MDYRRTAEELNGRQRKALRRLGKGKSISRTDSNDPAISRCYRYNIPKPPRGDDLNVVTWCDWEAVAMSAKPRLTEFGQAVHDELMKLDDERKLNGTF